MNRRIVCCGGALLSGLSTYLLVMGAVVFVWLAGAGAARAQIGVSGTVADFTFAGDSLASSGSNAFSNVTSLSTGTGLAGDFQFSTIFSVPDYIVPSSDLPLTEATAVSGSDYLSFTVTPKATYSLEYNQISFDLCLNVNDNTNPFVGDVYLRSSVDGFTSDLLTGSSSLNAGQEGESGEGGTFSLPAESGPVEFRLYFFDNQNSFLSTVGVTDIILTATPVPEPSDWAEVGMGVMLVVWGLKGHKGLKGYKGP